MHTCSYMQEHFRLAPFHICHGNAGIDKAVDLTLYVPFSAVLQLSFIMLPYQHFPWNVTRSWGGKLVWQIALNIDPCSQSHMTPCREVFLNVSGKVLHVWNGLYIIPPVLFLLLFVLLLSHPLFLSSTWFPLSLLSIPLSVPLNHFLSLFLSLLPCLYYSLSLPVTLCISLTPLRLSLFLLSGWLCWSLGSWADTLFCSSGMWAKPYCVTPWWRLKAT